MTTPEKTNWRITIPPAKNIVSCTMIDCAAGAAFYAYYLIATAALEAAMPLIQETPYTAFTDTIIPAGGITIGFLIMPTLIHTIFNAIKIPLLANGKVGPMKSICRLFITNIKLAITAFIAYSIFEWLGAALKPEFVVYTAGGYLLIALTMIILLSFISHSKIWAGSRSPIRDSILDIPSWKNSIPYLATIGFLLSIISAASYFAAGFLEDEYLVQSMTFIAAIISAAILNSYQWRLYRDF